MTLEKGKGERAQRYVMIDCLRGLAVLLMIIFHFAFDLNGFGLARIHFVTHPFWYLFPRFILFLFLICVGMGLALVHKNGIRWDRVKRRFYRIGGWALFITGLTYVLFPKNFVFFGALHCIAATSVAGVFFVGRPRLSFALFVLIVVPDLIFHPTLLPLTEWIGVKPLDYVPFLPWFGVVLLGIFLESIHFHRIAVSRRLWIRSLETMGRHSLKIYLAHRPIVFGMVFLFYKLKTST